MTTAASTTKYDASQDQQLEQKSRLLKLLTHGAQCKKSSNQDLPKHQRCNYEHCKASKAMLQHVVNCTLTQDECKEHYCKPAKFVLKHGPAIQKAVQRKQMQKLKQQQQQTASASQGNNLSPKHKTALKQTRKRPFPDKINYEQQAPLLWPTFDSICHRLDQVNHSKPLSRKKRARLKFRKLQTIDETPSQLSLVASEDNSSHRSSESELTATVFEQHSNLADDDDNNSSDDSSSSSSSSSSSGNYLLEDDSLSDDDDAYDEDHQDDPFGEGAIFKTMSSKPHHVSRGSWKSPVKPNNNSQARNALLPARRPSREASDSSSSEEEEEDSENDHDKRKKRVITRFDNDSDDDDSSSNSDSEDDKPTAVASAKRSTATNTNKTETIAKKKPPPPPPTTTTTTTTTSMPARDKDGDNNISVSSSTSSKSSSSSSGSSSSGSSSSSSDHDTGKGKAKAAAPPGSKSKSTPPGTTTTIPTNVPAKSTTTSANTKYSTASPSNQSAATTKPSRIPNNTVGWHSLTPKGDAANNTESSPVPWVPPDLSELLSTPIAGADHERVTATQSAVIELDNVGETDWHDMNLSSSDLDPRNIPPPPSTITTAITKGKATKSKTKALAAKADKDYLANFEEALKVPKSMDVGWYSGIDLGKEMPKNDYTALGLGSHSMATNKKNKKPVQDTALPASKAPSKTLEVLSKDKGIPWKSSVAMGATTKSKSSPIVGTTAESTSKSPTKTTKPKAAKPKPKFKFSYLTDSSSDSDSDSSSLSSGSEKKNKKKTSFFDDSDSSVSSSENEGTSPKTPKHHGSVVAASTPGVAGAKSATGGASSSSTNASLGSPKANKNPATFEPQSPQMQVNTVRALKGFMAAQREKQAEKATRSVEPPKRDPSGIVARQPSGGNSTVLNNMKNVVEQKKEYDESAGSKISNSLVNAAPESSSTPQRQISVLSAKPPAESAPSLPVSQTANASKITPKLPSAKDSTIRDDAAIAKPTANQADQNNHTTPIANKEVTMQDELAAVLNKRKQGIQSQKYQASKPLHGKHSDSTGRDSGVKSKTVSNELAAVLAKRNQTQEAPQQSQLVNRHQSSSQAIYEGKKETKIDNELAAALARRTKSIIGVAVEGSSGGKLQPTGGVTVEGSSGGKPQPTGASTSAQSKMPLSGELSAALARRKTADQGNRQLEHTNRTTASIRNATATVEPKSNVSNELLKVLAKRKNANERPNQPNEKSAINVTKTPALGGKKPSISDELAAVLSRRHTKQSIRTAPSKMQHTFTSVPMIAGADASIVYNAHQNLGDSKEPQVEIEIVSTEDIHAGSDSMTKVEMGTASLEEHSTTNTRDDVEESGPTADTNKNDIRSEESTDSATITLEERQPPVQHDTVVEGSGGSPVAAHQKGQTQPTGVEHDDDESVASEKRGPKQAPASSGPSRKKSGSTVQASSVSNQRMTEMMRNQKNLPINKYQESKNQSTPAPKKSLFKSLKKKIKRVLSINSKRKNKTTDALIKESVESTPLTQNDLQPRAISHSAVHPMSEQKSVVHNTSDQESGGHKSSEQESVCHESSEPGSVGYELVGSENPATQDSDADSILGKKEEDDDVDWWNEPVGDEWWSGSGGNELLEKIVLEALLEP